MARYKPTLTFAGSLEVETQEPLDARTVVPTKADLTVAGNFPYAYKGLPVYVEAEQKVYVLTDIDTTDINNWKEVGSGEGNTVSVELTQAEYDALTPAEKNNGTVYFITDGQGGGGGGDQWIVLSEDLVISANELRAIEDSKKPIMWFDGYYYTPITSMDTSVEWGNGYVEYFYNNYRYYIGFSYDGDDWDEPVTWATPYITQVAAKLELVNGNGGVRVSQSIYGKNASMWLYPDWKIPNFVNSQLVLSSSTKNHDLMTRYSQPQNIVKTGRVFVDIAQTGTGGYELIDISDLNFASTDDYMVMVSLEASVGTDTAICSSSVRQSDSFRVNVSRLSSGGGLASNFYVNYMVLANKYYELYSASTNITQSTASGDKYAWAQITTNQTAYNDFSVLKNATNNAKLRAYPPNSSIPYLAQYDTEGTETQDAEHWYYPIKWTNVDGTTGTPFDNFVYLARSKRGGQDNDMWLASAPSIDRLDTYQCPAIDKATIVREK